MNREMVIKKILMEIQDNKCTIERGIEMAFGAGFDHCRTTTRGSKPVLQIKNGEIINRYNSAKEAANKMKVTKATLNQAARGLKKTCRGYQWKYE